MVTYWSILLHWYFLGTVPPSHILFGRTVPPNTFLLWQNLPLDRPRGSNKLFFIRSCFTNKSDNLTIERAPKITKPTYYINVLRCDQVVYRSIPLSQHAQKQDQDSIIGRSSVYWSLYISTKKNRFGEPFSCYMDFTHSLLHNPIVGLWLHQPQPKFAEVGPKIRKLSRLTYCGIKDRIYFGTSASKGINSFLLVFHPKNVSEAGRWKGVLN